MRIYIIRFDAANFASLINLVNFAAEKTKQDCELHQRYLHHDSWPFNRFSGSSPSHRCQSVTSRFNRLGSITIDLFRPDRPLISSRS